MYESNTGKFLYQFFKERERVFLELKKKLDIRLDEEDVHNLRRSGKRIKAIIYLLGEIDEDFNPQKRFLPVRDIFNSAGEYRETQVNVKTLKSYSPSKDLRKVYSKHIFTQQELFKSNFIFALSSFDTKKHKKSVKKIKTLCAEVNNEQVINSSLNYIYRKLGDIKAFFSWESNEENVHNIRITFKKITPVTNLLYPLKVDGFNIDLISTIKDAEDKLGYWHDRVILKESLKSMIGAIELKVELAEELENLVYNLENENIQFINKLESLIFPVIEKIENVLD